MDNFQEMLTEYMQKGYTEQKFWPGEYVLLFNPVTGAKVRIYTNGDVWEAPKGEYFQVKPRTKE